MTEEFPPDHPYHRGVFWAWHQLYADGKRLGDGWTNDSIAQEVVKSVRENEKMIWFSLNLMFSGVHSVYGRGKPFMDEKTTITVHKLDSGYTENRF